MANIGLWPGIEFVPGGNVFRSSTAATWLNGASALTIISLHRNDLVDSQRELVNVDAAGVTQISVRYTSGNRRISFDQRWNNVALTLASANNTATTAAQTAGAAFSAGVTPVIVIDGLESEPGNLPANPTGTLNSTGFLEWGRGDRTGMLPFDGAGAFLAFNSNQLPVKQIEAMTAALLNPRNVYDLGVIEFPGTSATWDSANTAATGILLEYHKEPIEPPVAGLQTPVFLGSAGGTTSAVTAPFLPTASAATAAINLTLEDGVELFLETGEALEAEVAGTGATTKLIAFVCGRSFDANPAQPTITDSLTPDLVWTPLTGNRIDPGGDELGEQLRMRIFTADAPVNPVSMTVSGVVSNATSMGLIVVEVVGADPDLSNWDFGFSETGDPNPTLPRPRRIGSALLGATVMSGVELITSPGGFTELREFTANSQIRLQATADMTPTSDTAVWDSTNTTALSFLLELVPLGGAQDGIGELVAQVQIGGQGARAGFVYVDPSDIIVRTVLFGRGASAAFSGVFASGIASAEAVGAPTLSATLAPVGIASAEALGAPSLAAGTVIAVGIPSAAAFGTPALSIPISLIGIPSALSFGRPIVTGEIVIPPDGGRKATYRDVFPAARPTIRYEVRFDMAPGSHWVVTPDVRVISINRNLNTWPGAMEAGTCDLLLDDARGVYSPLQEAVHGGAFRPNLPVEILATVANADTLGVNSFFLFRGLIDGISADPALSERTVSVACRDYWKILQMREVSTDMFVETNVGSILSVAFDAASIGISQRSVDQISDIVPFAWFRNRRLDTVLGEFIEGAGYGAYVAGNGMIRVRDRYFDIGGNVQVSYAAFHSFNWSMDDAELVNRMHVAGAQRFHVPSQQVVSSLDLTITVPGKTNVSFFMDYQDPRNQQSAPAINVLTTPVNSRDFLMSTDFDGGGSLLMSTASARITPFGDAAKVNVYNGDTNIGYISRFHIRGEPVIELPNIAFESNVPASELRHGSRMESIETRLLTNAEQLERRAFDVLEQFSEPTPVVEISQIDDFPICFGLDLTDVVSVTNSHTGLENEFMTIYGLSHEIRADDVGIVHQMLLNLRRSRVLGAFFLDSDQLDIDRLGR